MSRERLPVAILGATGLVGQHLVRLLRHHPWFELAEVVGSERSAGRSYGDVVAWCAGGSMSRSVARTVLQGPDQEIRSRIVLSALPSAAALVTEPKLARAGHRISSNASAFRMDPDVPLIVPEVNASDVALVDRQPWAGTGGALVTNPNCVVAGLAPVLAPVHRRWGIRSAVVTTLQALSGAGLSGPGALELTGNVVPHIPDEEEKIAAETARLLGGGIVLDVAVTRVPVPDGHLAHVFLRLAEPVTPEEVVEVLRASRAAGAAEGLPSIPSRTLHVTEDQDRPQPRLDLGWGRGMAVSVGRVRRTGGHDIALTLLVHNLVRGAAGACLANAELLERHRA